MDFTFLRGPLYASPPRETMSVPSGRHLCQTASTNNAATRTAAAKSGKNNRPKSQSRKIHLALGPCKCRVLSPSRAARNAARYWHLGSTRLQNVRSAASNCIPAANALISIPRSISSVPNQSRYAFPEKMNGMSALSIPCGFDSKKKLRRRRLLSPWTLVRPSKTFSRNRSLSIAVSYGFCAGRKRISLAKDCGACDTIIATA